jgi:hypothetical protein
MSRTGLVFKALVFSLVGAILVYLGVGALLADEWRVESERLVPAAPAAVAALVGDFATWERWAAANVNLGAPTTRTIEGAPGAVGHRIVWQGPRGRSVLELTAVTAGGVDYSFANEIVGAEGAPAMHGGGAVRWRESPGGTLVTWTDHGVWGNLAGRWIGWFGALQHRMRQVQSASLEGLLGATTPGATTPAGTQPVNAK